MHNFDVAEFATWRMLIIEVRANILDTVDLYAVRDTIRPVANIHSQVRP